MLSFFLLFEIYHLRHSFMYDVVLNLSLYMPCMELVCISLLSMYTSSCLLCSPLFYTFNLFSYAISFQWGHHAINLTISSTFWQYQSGERVTLWVNKVGPYDNPQETYNYYSLPFCRPAENPTHKWGGLGEVLGGNELIDSEIEIKFPSRPSVLS